MRLLIERYRDIRVRDDASVSLRNPCDDRCQEAADLDSVVLNGSLVRTGVRAQRCSSSEALPTCWAPIPPSSALAGLL
jgi:hypothetical protein